MDKEQSGEHTVTLEKFPTDETVVKLSLKKDTPKIEVTMEPDEESNYTPPSPADTASLLNSLSLTHYNSRPYPAHTSASPVQYKKYAHSHHTLMRYKWQ